MTTTPPPDTKVQSETLDHIADRIAYKYLDRTVGSAKLKSDILSALRNEREAERDRITSAIAAMYWHFDCGSERDTVLAIPHLPSCTCLAKNNHEATEYQHHHHSCPVYIRVMAIREGR